MTRHEIKRVVGVGTMLLLPAFAPPTSIVTPLAGVACLAQDAGGGGTAQARQAEAQQADALMNAAVALAAAGQPEAAAQTYGKAAAAFDKADMYSNVAFAWNEAAKVLEAAGKHEEQAQALEKVADSNEKQVKLLQTQSQIKGTPEAELSIEDLRGYLQDKMKQAAEAHDKAAKAYEAAGKPAEQAKALEKSAAMYEKLADLLASAAKGGAPVTTPAATTPQPAAPAAPAPVPPGAKVAPSVPVQAVTLSPLAPKPGFIIGRAVLENGQPIPKFHVHAAAVSGEFNLHVGGQVGDTFENCDGVNGQYSMRMRPGVTVFGIGAQTTIMVNGEEFVLDLWPTDNKPDSAGKEGFRGDTSRGIVRDFVFKMSGYYPDYDPAKYPDYSNNFNRNAINPCYGGSLNFNCTFGSTEADRKGGYRTSLPVVFSEQSAVTVTLTPTGPRIDSLPGQTLKRRAILGHSGFTLYGIPYGPYSIAAELTEPNGTAHKLRISDQLPTQDPFEWKPSVTIKPENWKSRYSLIAQTLYLARQ